MRILFSHYLPYEKHVVISSAEGVSGGLRDRGHEVLLHRCFYPPIAPPESAGPGAKPPGTLQALKSKIRGRLWFAKAIHANRSMERRDMAAIQEFKPDIVLARQDAYCVSMTRAASRLGVPVVTLADAPVAYETRQFGYNTGRWHPPGLMERMEVENLRRSVSVVAVSHGCVSRLKLYGVDLPYFVVPNGIYPDRFPMLSPEERRRKREELGITARHVAGFVGTFRTFHGVDRLEEFVRGTAHRKDLQWLLIGGGPEQPRIKESLKDCPQAVLLGSRPVTEIGTLLNLLDVAVIPHAQLKGDFYFCPLKILESGAAGCAIVAGAQGDIPLMLDNGRVGTLMYDYATESWVKAIENLIDAPEQARAMGQEARRWVLDNYSWDHAGAKLEHALKESLALARAKQK